MRKKDVAEAINTANSLNYIACLKQFKLIIKLFTVILEFACCVPGNAFILKLLTSQYINVTNDC